MKVVNGLRKMQRYTILLNGVNSFDDFVQATNEGFIEHLGGNWSGSLDAFNDYLSWADGEYELEFVGAIQGRTALGYRAYAKWLKECARDCHEANRENVLKRLELADREQGETLYDILKEIIRHNPHAHLIEN